MTREKEKALSFVPIFQQLIKKVSNLASYVHQFMRVEKREIATVIAEISARVKISYSSVC